MPSIRPVAQITASFMPGGRDGGVEPLAVRLGVGELQRIGRPQVRCRAPSQSPSNSIRSRSAAPIRKWCAHFGQTLSVADEVLVVDDLAARRALDPQPLGHPARLSSPGGSIGLRTFLNQAIWASLPLTSDYLLGARHVVPRALAHARASASAGRRAPRRPTRDRTARFRRPAAAWRCSGRRSGCRPRSARGCTRRRAPARRGWRARAPAAAGAARRSASAGRSTRSGAGRSCASSS